MTHDTSVPETPPPPPPPPPPAAQYVETPVNNTVYAPPPPAPDAGYAPPPPAPDAGYAPPPPAPAGGAYAAPPQPTDGAYVQPPPPPPAEPYSSHSQSVVTSMPAPPPVHAASYVSHAPSVDTSTVPQAPPGAVGYDQPPLSSPAASYIDPAAQQHPNMNGQYVSQAPAPGVAGMKDPEMGQNYAAAGDVEGDDVNANLMILYGAIIGLFLGLWGLFFLCCACCCAWVPRMQQNPGLRTKWLIGWLGGVLANVLLYGIVIVRRNA